MGTPSEQVSIFDIIKSTKSLPKIPRVTAQLMELTSDKNSDVNAMGELIALDPELTLLVLKLVNSAHYSPNNPVHSVTRAVQLLGFKTVCFIVMGASTIKTINDYATNSIIDPFEFWTHSFKCALATQYLATIGSYVNPFEGYLVGLFHDIGKIILAKHLEKKYTVIVERCILEQKNLPELEKVSLGFSHADVSALIVSEWQLNEDLAEVIASHHDAEQVDQIKCSDLGYLLYLGNQICHLQTEVLFDDEEFYESLGRGIQDYLFSAFNIASYEQFSQNLINPTIEHLDENEHFYQNLLGH